MKNGDVVFDADNDDEVRTSVSQNCVTVGAFHSQQITIFEYRRATQLHCRPSEGNTEDHAMNWN
jgi:hypothetical protein